METSIDVAYIQKQDGEFVDINCFTAWQGFKLMGVQTEFFSLKQLIDGYMPIPLSKTTLVCGNIGPVKRALKEIGVKEPIIEDYPLELKSYLGRKIWSSTLGEIKNYQQKIFIKPKIDVKLFTGYVRTGQIKDLFQTAMCPDETEIYVSEVVNFVSEYRVFVNEGLMVGCRHYKGDFTIYPDFEIVSKAINDYISAPIGYSADFGVTDDGRTLLVEINDAFSIGCYGLNNLAYAKMLKDRWLEIVNV